MNQTHKVICLMMLMALVAGCASLNPFRKHVLDRDDISSKDKLIYAEKVEEFNYQMEQAKLKFDEFRIYHYGAIVLFVLGGFNLFIAKQYALGIGAFLTGFIVSGWALYAPTNENAVGYFLVGMIGLSIAFLVWRVYYLITEKKKKVTQ